MSWSILISCSHIGPKWLCGQQIQRLTAKTVYLQRTDSLPPLYAANFPHLIGISRTIIPLCPTSKRYFDEALNSMECTSNKGASVHTKDC